MSDIEKRKAEIMAKANAEIEKAKIECAIVEELPLHPAFVHVYPLYGRVGTVKYNAVDASDAVRIYESFREKAPSYVCRSGSTVSVKAFDDESAEHVLEAVFIVEIQKHSQAVEFNYKTKAGIVRIEIDMGFSPFGSYYVTERNRTKYYRWEVKLSNLIGGLYRVANYARTQSYGEMSAPHMLFAGFENFEFYDVMGVNREN